MESEYAVEYVSSDASGLTLSVSGRVDASNHEEFSADIHRERAEHPDGALILDMNELYYISSAGLRVLLALVKEEPERLQIRNLEPDLYEIFDDTGYVDIMDVTAKAAAEEQ